MKIITTPPALKVQLDGVTIGRSPMKLTVPPGAHMLTVTDDKATGSFPIAGENVPARLCYEVAGRKVKEGSCQ